MNFFTAKFVLENVAIFVSIFWVVISFTILIEFSNGNFERDQLDFRISVLMLCVPCFVGLFVLTGDSCSSPRFDVKKIAFECVLLTSFCGHFSLVVVNFKDWETPGCENDIMSFCTGGNQDFFSTILVTTLLHAFFIGFYIVLFIYFQNMPESQNYSRRRYPHFSAEVNNDDDDDTSVQGLPTDPENPNT